MAICRLSPKSDLPSPDYPDLLIGAAETAETLSLRREDGDNRPVSHSEAVSRRLHTAWSPFIHKPATRENYIAMAEAAKAAFAGMLSPELLATFEVEASMHSNNGVDLLYRLPEDNGVPTNIASLLPAENAQVTAWGGRWIPRESDGLTPKPQ